MNLKDTYNTIAEDWFKDHHDDAWWVEGTDQFISLLKKGDVVLDVGCGAGVKSKYLSEKEFKVVGIDFSDKMVKIARREVGSAVFYVADVKDLSSIPETFDGIFAQAVLLHIPKAEVMTTIAGLKNKLKDGGYLYIAVKEKRPEGKEEEVRRENDYGYRYERFFSYFVLPELKEYLAELRMKMCYENISRVGDTNWIQVICQK